MNKKLITGSLISQGRHQPLKGKLVKRLAHKGRVPKKREALHRFPRGTLSIFVTYFLAEVINSGK
jgi:hypothetical protein